jgi:hypothetical protein
MAAETETDTLARATTTTDRVTIVALTRAITTADPIKNEMRTLLNNF